MAFTATENDVVKYFDALGTGASDNPYIPRRVLGKNDLATDVWGTPIFGQKTSLGRGLFTFEVPKNHWLKLINGTEVLDTSADASILSENGRLKVTSTGGTRYTAQTRAHMRYQPNRGQQYSDSVWVGTPGVGGKLYFVIRTISGATVTDTRTEIVGHGLDLSKGNVFDLAFQWRGAGDYWAYGNLKELLHLERLGTTTALTVANPAMPVFYEAIQGAHTLGGLARTGSAVRWGMGTYQNGVFFEYEYPNTATPTIYVGCWDVSSQGGQSEALTFGSVATGRLTSNDGIRPMIALRVPDTRTVGGNSWKNTRDVILSRVSASAVDESEVSVWYTRDATAISLTLGTWTYDAQTGSVQYILNNDLGGATTKFTLNTAKCIQLLSNTVPIDVVVNFDNPLGEDGKFRLSAGDHIIVCHQTAGVDLASATVYFGAEI